MKMKFKPPEICPVCGEDVPSNARACPECGADEKSGWKPDAQLNDALDLPEPDFKYEEFVSEEFGIGKRPPRIQFIWIVVAVVLVVALLLLLLMF